MNDNEDFEKLLSSFRASSAAVAATVAEQDNSSIPFILEMMEEEEELAFGPNNKMMKGRRQVPKHQARLQRSIRQTCQGLLLWTNLQVY